MINFRSALVVSLTFLCTSVFAETDPMKFTLFFDATEEEGIFIVGDHPLLGNGDITRAPMMVRPLETDEKPIWKLGFDFGDETPTQYRYVLRQLVSERWGDVSNGEFVGPWVAVDSKETEKAANQIEQRTFDSPSRTFRIDGFEHELDPNGQPRNLYVYLPPGYDESEERYPVLYMHDGSNIFESIPDGPFGQWNADRAADVLIHSGKIDPIVIVGINNSPNRILEYLPPEDDFRDDPGIADQTANYYINAVKPYIDENYRTNPDPEVTSVSGSSMGGLLSMYFLWHHHEEFAARAGALSPSFRIFPDLMNWFEENSVPANVRLWMDNGTGSEPTYDSMFRTYIVRDHFLRDGTTISPSFQHHIYAGAQHNEPSWAARFEEVLLFLYGKK